MESASEQEPAWVQKLAWEQESGLGIKTWPANKELARMQEPAWVHELACKQEPAWIQEPAWVQEQAWVHEPVLVCKLGLEQDPGQGIGTGHG